ncbi:unnamed protein product [Parajaminaea phylloscopi]
MASEEDIAKVMAKGASRPQATAALASIGCVADAIEALRAGVFGPFTTRRAASLNSSASSDAPDDGDSDDSDSLESYSGGLDSDDGLDLEACTRPDGGGGDKRESDPYQGIDMRRDRTETIIEGLQEAETFALPDPLDTGNTSLQCSELTQSEWMKGVSYGAEQSFLFDIYQKLHLEPVCCPNTTCGTAAPRPPHGFFVLFPTLREYLAYLETTLVHSCTACKTTTFCLACGEVPQSHPCVETTEHKGGAADAVDAASAAILHCRLSASVAVGVGLAHVERIMDLDHIAAVAAPVPAKSTPKRRKARQATKATPFHDGHDEDSYYLAPGDKNGVGYGGFRDDYSWSGKALTEQLARDERICGALRSLRPYLPNERRKYVKLPGSSTVTATGPLPVDLVSEITILAHLRRRFLPIASAMLQSRSIVDMSDRLHVFQELIAWLTLLSEDTNTAPLLAQPIMRLTKRTQRKSRTGDGIEVESVYEASPGPRELVEEVVEQAKALLQSLRKAQRRDDDAAAITPATQASSARDVRRSAVDLRKAQEAQRCDEVMAMCASIIESVVKIDSALQQVKGLDFLRRLLASFQRRVSEAPGSEAEASQSRVVAKRRGGSKVTDDTQAQAECERLYRAWAKPLAFGEADMTQRSSSGKESYLHRFDKDITDTCEHSNSKRNLIISKELAGLKGTLPAEWDSAFFVRVDESRLDVLKALIAGPPDSPYKDGLFAFDIFLPTAYNTEPPKVQITTSNGGKVRFGPNLYACGKVCLSLLGTWSGPGWSPGNSTLLQVLLSISSMVMGEKEPAINEPGWASYGGRPESLAYTKNVRRQTVRHAMLNQLKEPQLPWADVIKGHFKHKRASLEKQLTEWLREDDGRAHCNDGASFFCRVYGETTPEKTIPVGPKPGAEFKRDVEELLGLLKDL